MLNYDEIAAAYQRERVLSSQNMLSRLKRNPAAEMLMQELAASAEEKEVRTIFLKTAEEAVHLGALMCERGIPHNLGCSKIARKCGRWLADIFWDYSGRTIDRDEFFSRCALRLNNMEYSAERLWKAVLGGGEKADMLNIIKRVRAEEVPEEFYQDSRVILFAEPLNTSYNWGRHKTRVELERKAFLRGNRAFRTVEVGMDGDVDIRGFVVGSFEDSIEKQMYISSEIKPLDRLCAECDSGGYILYHGETAVGRLSENFSAEICGIGEIGRIEDIYVSAVTSEPILYDGEKMPRLCYGIEITGLARIR